MYVKKVLNPQKKVYLIGSTALAGELKNEGIQTIDLEVSGLISKVVKSTVCHAGHRPILYIVASELKDPICHSLEWQIGSFSDDIYVEFFSELLNN